MIARRTPLRRTWLKRKPRRYVVPPEILAYWDWIREQPCAVHGEYVHHHWLIEVAHVGFRGMSQKCDGWEVLPLCRYHHNRDFKFSHHTLGKRFWTFHNLDRSALIRHYRTLYALSANRQRSPQPSAQESAKP